MFNTLYIFCEFLLNESTVFDIQFFEKYSEDNEKFVCHMNFKMNKTHVDMVCYSIKILN